MLFWPMGVYCIKDLCLESCQYQGCTFSGLAWPTFFLLRDEIHFVALHQRWWCSGSSDSLVLLSWEWPTWPWWVKRGHLPAALGQVLWAWSSSFDYLPWEETGVLLCLRWAVSVGRPSLSSTRLFKGQGNIISRYREIIIEILHPLTSCFICCKKYSLLGGYTQTWCDLRIGQSQLSNPTGFS